ncbi:hypothetical protein QUF70_05925 [Desulfobacterales bacterium HSG17]|nr:hypothetical protein [Desulfobacterales bacterium HSG17]
MADIIANVFGILNMLEATRHSKMKRFVLASSGASIGECILPTHDELTHTRFLLTVQANWPGKDIALHIIKPLMNN